MHAKMSLRRECRASFSFQDGAKKSPPQAGQEPAEGEVVRGLSPPNFR